LKSFIDLFKFQLKSGAQTLAEMNAFLQRRQEEDEKLRNEIENIQDQLNRWDFLPLSYMFIFFHDTVLKHFTVNLEIIFQQHIRKYFL